MEIETLETQSATWCCPPLQPFPSGSLSLPPDVLQLTSEQVAIIQTCLPYELGEDDKGEPELRYQRPLPNVTHR